MNLLDETLKCMEEHNKTEFDVKFVSSFRLCTDWEHFKLNSNFEYDDGYGCNEINLNLKIVGDNWWLERHEYDGSEWWEYKEIDSIDMFRIAKPHEVMNMIKGGTGL